MQITQHLPRQIRRASPTRNTQLDILLLDRRQDAGYFVVETVAAAVGVADGVAGVFAAGRRLFERRVDVRVDPKRPQRVVEVEDDEFGQRLAIAEGGRCEDFGGGEGDCCCWVRC